MPLQRIARRQWVHCKQTDFIAFTCSSRVLRAKKMHSVFTRLSQERVAIYTVCLWKVLHPKLHHLIVKCANVVNKWINKNLSFSILSVWVWFGMCLHWFVGATYIPSRDFERLAGLFRRIMIRKQPKPKRHNRLAANDSKRSNSGSFNWYSWIIMAWMSGNCTMKKWTNVCSSDMKLIKLHV